MTVPSSTRVPLLDVNVLIALAWPNHESHTVASAWFARHAAAGWATSAFTESGFVRVSCNRRAMPTATSPARAVEMLSRLIVVGAHVFWEDAVPMVTGGMVAVESLTGHRQITDAHLVALAVSNGGRLVTFDRAIENLSPEGSDAVQCLDAALDPG